MIPIRPEWISENRIHNPENSRFLSIASGKVKPYELWAQAIYKDGEVISAAIYEKYPDTAAFWGSFTCNRKRFLMRCHGRIGLFTKIEHRNQGHAQTALEFMLAEILMGEIPNTINIIAGAPRILKRFGTLDWPRWAALRAPIGRNFWEEDLRKRIGEGRTPPFVSTRTAIEVLKSKGYIEKEVDGRMRLHDETKDPEHGTLKRTETLTLPDPRKEKAETSAGQKTLF
jgi:hypothetical protein